MFDEPNSFGMININITIIIFDIIMSWTSLWPSGDHELAQDKRNCICSLGAISSILCYDHDEGHEDGNEEEGHEF